MCLILNLLTVNVNIDLLAVVFAFQSHWININTPLTTKDQEGRSSKAKHRPTFTNPVI
jgi:hypothetical protein